MQGLGWLWWPLLMRSWLRTVTFMRINPIFHLHFMKPEIASVDRLQALSSHNLSGPLP